HAADKADLQYPLDVAVSPDGTIYIADRKLPGIWSYKDGALEKFFEGSKKFRTPLNAVRCVGVAEDGTVFAGDSSTREVYKFDGEKKPVPLTDGYIGIAADILVEKDQVIASDLELQRIWSFPIDGGEPKELAVIAGVRGLARDAEGNLLCVTTLEDPVRKVEDDGSLTVLIKDRPFDLPHHAVFKDGALFIPDNYAVTIWKAPLDGTAPTPLAKGEPLNRPVGICLEGDNFLIADPHAKDIFRITPDGKVTSIFAE
ncbi:MAG: hypothetical protein KDA80_22610, partial [Planctomycetaceae bacterium]|nr:hypothetical protein [Planctomycetaceae bacterium]